MLSKEDAGATAIARPNSRCNLPLKMIRRGFPVKSVCITKFEPVD